MTVDAVIFDLDGVLIDSELLWDQVRRGYVAERGGQWTERATRDLMGMSSPEWSAYLHDELGVPDEPAAINQEVAGRVGQRYREQLPVVPGAQEAVERLAHRWRLGLASSSNRTLIDTVLDQAGLTRFFAATVSSEEVGRGKPAPDVYLEAAAALGVEPANAAAIEDSTNGIRSAHAAGLRVLAVPNPHLRPDDEALGLAQVVVESLDELTPDVVAGSIGPTTDGGDRP